MNKHNDNEIIDAVNKHKSVRAAAIYLNMPDTSLRLHLKRLGIKKKTIRELDVNDIVGKRFGMLIVKQFINKSIKQPWKYFYSCDCDCGKTNHIIVRNNLTCNHTISCGCLRKLHGKNNKSWTGYEEISGRTWASIKKHAITRKLEFNINIEDAWNQLIKQNKKCALTGLNISTNLISKNNKYDYTQKTASLDRIDSNKGYILDNIQWVHKDINYIKMDVSQTDFIRLCTLVATYTKNK